MTDPRRVLPGRKPGDRRVRVERPQARYFRYQAPGVLSAKLAVEEPATPLGAALARTRRVLFGRPLSTEEEILERLPKWKALPVFSSDVMSSVAYATEASLYTLLGVGTLAFAWLLPISVAIVGVLALVTLSYRQTIRAYPNGGGSYIVAHANLGVLPGLVAAAALLTDYVLTVAVSVSSGVQALYSLFPPLLPLAVPIIVASILLVMTVNLRGIRESGTIFAAPTYIFLGSALFMIGLGVLRTLLGQAPHVTGVVPAHVPAETFGLLLLMRAFADGCSAMTGTEAVANGVPAFKPPEWRERPHDHARHVAAARDDVPGHVAPRPRERRAPLGQRRVRALADRAVGVRSGPTVVRPAALDDGHPDPRGADELRRLPARRVDPGQGRVLPPPVRLPGRTPGVQRWDHGPRRSCRSCSWSPSADSVEALIPLYAIGVFTAFTLSQAGMVRHWFRERGSGWRTGAPSSTGSGATTTAIVVVIFAIAKFALGAWIILVVVPILIALMLFVHHEYTAEGVRVSRSAAGRSSRRRTARSAWSLRRPPSTAPWCRRSGSARR